MMDTTRKKVLSLKIWLVIVMCIFIYTDCIRFKKYDFKRYRCVSNGTTFRADNVHNINGCLKLCHNSSQCTSFSYQPDIQRCIGCRRAIQSYITKDGYVQYSSKYECPDGWIQNKASCYYMHYEFSYYPESENFCRQLDSHLVHLETQDENAFVKGLLINGEGAAGSYWIGMTPGNFRDYCDVKQRWDYNCNTFFHGCNFRWLRTKCNTTKAIPLCEV